MGKKHFYIVIILFSFPFRAWTAISLEEAYQAALVNTEVMPINRAKMEQARAKKYGSFANFLPELSFESSRTDDEIKKKQTYSRASFSQEIFSGWKDISTVSQNKATFAAKEWDLKFAKQSTYASVAQSFYFLLASEKEAENMKRIIALARDRVGEIKSRTKIGRSRNIELLAAQAQLAVLEAGLKSAEGQLKSARDQFTLLTGIMENIGLQETKENFRKPNSLEFYLSKLEDRADIHSQKLLLEASQYGIRAAKADFFPTLTADGNYYFSRTGTQAANDWDISITATIPLFSGGSTWFKVRENSAYASEVEASLAQKRRQAENEIRTTYNSLRSLLEQVSALEAALIPNEKNYKEQEKNYRFGQATNLDVIQALNSYQDTKRSLDHIRYQAMLAWEMLKASTAQFE